MYNYRVYNITYSEYFLYKWSTRLQSMYNHMVGRAASVISPFYSLLPDLPPLTKIQSTYIWFLNFKNI